MQLTTALTFGLIGLSTAAPAATQVLKRASGGNLNIRGTSGNTPTRVLQARQVHPCPNPGDDCDLCKTAEDCVNDYGPGDWDCIPLGPFASQLVCHDLSSVEEPTPTPIAKRQEGDGEDYSCFQEPCDQIGDGSIDTMCVKDEQCNDTLVCQDRRRVVGLALFENGVIHGRCTSEAPVPAPIETPLVQPIRANTARQVQCQSDRDCQAGFHCKLPIGGIGSIDPFYGTCVA